MRVGDPPVSRTAPGQAGRDDRAADAPDKPSKFAIVERAELCAGVGRVRVRAEATSEHGVSITETTLLAFSP